ncbi:hypothetical protein [Palleronia marisminoris]|nr:hypothetical protein [Palleronia marisminoris]
MRAFVLLAALAAGPAAAQTPDWCGASSLNTAERTICTTPALQWRDRAVNRLWGRLDGRAGTTVRRDNWLASRNACGSNVACLTDSYDARIFEMRELAGIGDRPRLRPWCDTGGLSATEQTICGTPRLADYDAALQHLSDTLDNAPGPDGWLSRRDSCGTDAVCIEDSYLDRFATLGAIARTRE